MSDVTQESTGPRYPEVKLKLVGEDGNAWSIMARASTALKRAGVEQAEIDEYIEESMSGDYNNLLRTAMRWCDCDGGIDELLEDED
jgi:hypothetical protein